MNLIKGKGPIYDPGLCRCCGSMKKCRLLNVEYESFGQKEIYSDMFMDCFGLLISHLDGVPTERLICATCVRQLREATSFRQQVLRCEEAFLQMKHFDETSDCEESKAKEAILFKTDMKVVKLETNMDDPADEGEGDDCEPNCDYAPDMANEDSTSNDDVPLEMLTRKKPVTGPDKPVTGPDKPVEKPVAKKPVTTQKLPISKVQELIRAQDASYKTENNVLNIVECSYACPFKCRHNNLLCYYCGAGHADPAALRAHTESSHSPKKFKLTDYKNMLKLDITRIDCRLCPTKIDTIAALTDHISKEHDKKYYHDHRDSILPFKLSKEEIKCAICGQSFAYFHALNKHMNVHFSNYVCETCGLGFVDRGRFVMHQQRHEVGDYPCTTCGKNFKAAYNRDLHIDRVHNKRGRVYCPKCDVMLMSYHQKLKHLVEVHGDAPLSFPCESCERVFETRRSLTIHRRKDHLRDYRYECQCCGQKFFTRFALNNHMPTHTGERNFKCKVCEKSYPRRKTLRDHMKIHTNDRRYRCHICGQAFIQNCSLKGHMKSQHPEYS